MGRCWPRLRDSRQALTREDAAVIAPAASEFGSQEHEYSHEPPGEASMAPPKSNRRIGIVLSRGAAERLPGSFGRPNSCPRAQSKGELRFFNGLSNARSDTAMKRSDRARYML